jgi:hypothetical protein
MRGILKILIVLCWAALFGGSAMGQSEMVKVKFEVDGQEIRQKFKITIYAGDETIEPCIEKDGFIVPPAIKKYEKVGVRFVSGSHDLFFDSVYLPKFGSDWVVGVDKKPFAEENLPERPHKKIKLIYYINFISRTADGTRMVVQVHD